MLIDNKAIAIVGGGPGGLILARLLQQKGATVKVYERDYNKNARLIGSPLDMHEASGLAALRKANLLNEFKKNYRVGADKKNIVNEQAEIFFSDHKTKLEENFGHEHFRPEIDRSPLRNILLESLKTGSVEWEKHFISMEAKHDGWLLHFKNGTSAYADLVIAADGANSKIRPYLTNITAFYSGITMLEINIHNSDEAIPHINTLLNGGKVMAFGNEKCLLGGQKGNNEIGFYASLKADESWAANNGLSYTDNTQLLEWFKTTYTGWSSIWYELFKKAESPIIPRPIYCMPLNQTWKALPNLTILGDAAHVMPPFAGEGANMAMFDALELSEFLTAGKYNTVQEAIAFYEINMRKRAAIAARKSLENGERMHSAAALSIMLEFFSGH